MAAELKPIPHPPTVPFLGNTLTIEQDVPLRSFMLLAKQYGEIYQLSLGGREIVEANSYALLHFLSNENHFYKRVFGPLLQVRNLVVDGLFTGQLDETAWGVAHRILMPVFSSIKVLDMLPDMKDIASQLVLKWDRHQNITDHFIDPSDDFARLAFDTIALCAMSYRVNSFYSVEAPPFVKHMFDFLHECFNRAARPAFMKPLMHQSNVKYEADIKWMVDFSESIVHERKANPTDKKDLLNTMLNAVDTKTGLKMTEDNIVKNLLTFLIAGHETTSGLLSFGTCYLLKNPHALAKLREELDSILGDDYERGYTTITTEDIAKMKYVTAILRETLRLSPSAPTRSTTPKEDIVLEGSSGKYFVKAETPVTLQISVMMRDPAVWGEDADEFKPERMLDENFEKLPPHAWQPFGFGVRGCIGRPFAWQEAHLVLASVFHHFDVFLEDPSYDLRLKQALTIKPDGMRIRVATRAPKAGAVGRVPRPVVIPKSTSGGSAGSVTASGKKRCYIAYGSNTGTCESFAQKLASSAGSHGFNPSIYTLDAGTNRIPTDGPVLIVTASFEGQPADNAAQFVEWLEHIPAGEDKKFGGVKYAVFGCGNHEWHNTYQRIPTLVDNLLAQHGAEKIIERGEADVSTVSFFQVFDEWETKLWVKLGEVYGVEGGAVETLSVEVTDSGTARATALRQADVGVGKVIENRILTKPGVPVKRHIEFKLPPGMTYRAGDYLAVIPTNPSELVQRSLARLGFSAEQEIVIHSQTPTTLPTEKPVTIQQVLSGYVELSQPATTQSLKVLLEAAKEAPTRDAINHLQNYFETDVIAKRLSVLDILEAHADINLPLLQFLKLLPAMRVRQYSISSSPLVNPTHVTLTVSIVDAPSHSDHNKRYLGVASNYLGRLAPGDHVQIAVRASAVAFHPPSDPKVPMVMFAVGSGMAPFHGFIQERMEQKKSGREIGKSLLFFGCRSPDEDYLYSDSDLAEWIAAGVVEVYPAFSRETDASEGCKYVQNRIVKEGQHVSEAFKTGAKFFTCGNRQAANGVKAACIELMRTVNSISHEDAEARFEAIQKERYSTDVFD